jgi:hypothetical protein
VGNPPPDVTLIRLGAGCALVELPERLCQIKLEPSMHLGERRGWDGLAREDAACRDRPSRSWSEADAGPGRQMGQPPTSVASCSTRSVPSYVPVAVLSLAWRGCCQQLPPTPSPINTRAALSTSTATATAIANVETSTVPAEDVASVAGRVGACVPSYLEDSRCSRAHCRPLDSTRAITPATSIMAPTLTNCQ